MRRHLLVLATVICISCAVSAQQQTTWQPPPGHGTRNLGAHGAPGSRGDPQPEANTTTAQDRTVAGRAVVRIGNISTPTLTVFAPREKNTGAAVVVFPGGSYRIVA